MNEDDGRTLRMVYRAFVIVSRRYPVLIIYAT